MAHLSEGKISFVSFFIGTLSFVVSLFFSLSQSLKFIWTEWWILLFLVYTVFANVLMWILFNTKDAYQIALRGCFLGCACGFGLIISSLQSSWSAFGWYFTSLSIFHWSEYFTTAVTNPRSLTIDSYMLDHSFEYKAAAVVSWIEFAVEWYFFPELKQPNVVSIAGLLLVIFGEVLRKVSMVTASTNFNHYVQYKKQEGHQLVQHGVYSLCRHPSYVGWFYWSIGTQLILCNPVCLIGYTIISWRFFRQRIVEEEIYLYSFFGKDYTDYQRKVVTGLPFIEGYTTHLFDQSK